MIEGSTRIVVKKNTGTKVFALASGAALLIGIVGIIFAVSQRSAPIGENAQVVRPYGDKAIMGMDIWLVYSQVGQVPVRIETPNEKVCHISNGGSCQELTCAAGFETIVTVCKGGYILKIGDRK